MRYTPAVQKYIDSLPRWYSGKLNFVGMLLCCLTTIVILFINLKDPTLSEWLLIPLFFVFANGVEWFIHSTLLHKEYFFSKELYRRHSLLHHAAYTHEDMTFRKDREIGLVLFPVWAFPTILLMISPIPIVLMSLEYHNVALLFVATSTAYYLFYECFHFAHHLDEKSIVARIPLFKKAKWLHLRHHDPKIMKTKNFNIFFPLFDWILGTLEEKQKE